MDKNIEALIAEAKERPTEVLENIKAVHGEAAAAFANGWLATVMYQQKVCALCDTYGVHPIVHSILHVMAADVMKANTAAAIASGMSDKAVNEIIDMVFSLARAHSNVEGRLMAEMKKQRGDHGEG